MCVCACVCVRVCVWIKMDLVTDFPTMRLTQLAAARRVTINLLQETDR